MKRLVLDTNTIVSAQFWQGPPREVYDLVRAGRYQLLSSREIESEFIRVLGYPKFGLAPMEILPIINDYKRYAVTVPVVSRVDAIQKDKPIIFFSPAPSMDRVITSSLETIIYSSSNLSWAFPS